MQKITQKLVPVCAIVFLIFTGIGCGGSAGKGGPQESKLIDADLKLYADIPKEWTSTKFNALYKSSQSPSGLSYLSGASNMGFGPTDQKGEILVKVHVIAVPKSDADMFEKNKYPASAERRFESGAFVIYTSVVQPQDPDVMKFTSSLHAGN